MPIPKWNSKEVLFDSFYMVFISLSGLFTLFGANVFSIASKQAIQERLHEDGIFVLVVKHYIGSAAIGLFFTVCITSISMLIVAFTRPKDWSEPKYVFKVSLVCQLLCALAGSLLFLTTLLRIY